MKYEVMPTETDQKHILPLAQQILDLVQPYAREHGMSLQGVMSAIGTASGGMIARAYRDPETSDAVCGHLSIAARQFAKALRERDEKAAIRAAKTEAKQ